MFNIFFQRILKPTLFIPSVTQGRAKVAAESRKTVGKLFTTQSRLFATLKQRAFENIVGKEENAGNQHFLLFSTMFSALSKKEIDILRSIKFVV